MINRSSEHGAVSLFIVIFTMVLISVLTVSFVRVMISDQQRATAADLSQSAYDSAQAGVEDAKRALLACEAGDVSVCQALETDSCTMLQDAGISTFVTTEGGNREVPIQTSVASDNDQALDQAYTCVKVEADTTDYPGVLTIGDSQMIPLRGTESFTSVQLSWFSYEDISSAAPGADHSVSLPTPLPSADGTQYLYTQDNWPTNRPSLVRAQLIQFNTTGFNLNSFDKPDEGSNASTLFLYPGAGLPTKSFDLDGRQDSTNAPEVVKCVNDLSAEAYACTVTLQLPEPIGGDENNRAAYLRLSSLYNNTHYTLSLKNDGGETVRFDNVLPAVDSTGRANDQFRRVESRINLLGDFPYPEYAVDVDGGFCKNFVVTDNASDNPNGAACTTP